LSFWIENTSSRLRISPIALVCAISVTTYLAGLALAFSMGNVKRFFLHLEWLLTSAFGFVSGFSIIFSLKRLKEAVLELKPLLNLEEIEIDDLFLALREKALSRLYWIIVGFWLVFSTLHLYLVKKFGFSSSNIVEVASFYGNPPLMEFYGWASQAINGCILGGTFMFVIPIGMNLAYWELCSKIGFNNKALTISGRKFFSGFRKLITANTMATAVSSGLAMGIWGRYILFIPLIGSLLMFLPTAIVPHFLLHKGLSKTKEDELCKIERKIENMNGLKKANVNDLFQLQNLLGKEGRIRNAKTWIIDLSFLGKLILSTLITQAIAFLISLF